MVVVFLVLFLVSVISLGSFGVIQAKVSKHWPTRAQSCVLFASYVTDDDSDKTYAVLSTIGYLHTLGPDFYVAFVWLIYNSVLLTKL